MRGRSVSTAGIASDPAFDATLALLREGYEFVSRRCEAFGSDAFRTRLLLRPVTCARGADAVGMFYHSGRFTRRGAIPPTTVALLQDFGSVQQQDGEGHRRRKRLFLDLLAPPQGARMAALLREAWRGQAQRWSRQDRVVLLEEARAVLCRVACRWAGVPASEDELRRLGRDLGMIVDGAGSYGPRLLRGLRARARIERWARAAIHALRAGGGDGKGDTPAAAVASWREEDGSLLPETVAAIELVNLLRPTVAVAQWIAFAALALHEHPAHREWLHAREPRALLHFVQEVRRFYPFFPMIGGYVREPFEWHGHPFTAGDWVMLDLYGTNHDPRLWERPDRFDPARFRAWDDSPQDLVAQLVSQGAGDPATDHRCPGEDASIALLMAAVDELANGMRFEVPEQDLTYRLDRFPSMPASGFVIRAVRLQES